MMMSKMLLLFAIPLIVFHVGVAVAENEVYVEYSDSFIHTAECSFEPQPGNKLDVMVLTQDAYEGGDRNLKTVSGRCWDSSCRDPAIRVAVRRHMSSTESPSKLMIGWEPSLSMDVREDVFMCEIFSSESHPKTPASLRQIPARKFRWYINKTEANVSSDSLLEIEFKDVQGGWSTISSREVGQPKEQAASIKFYDLEGGAEGVNILKLVDTAQVAVVTLLISNDSKMLKDPRCRIKVGNYRKDCNWTMPTKQGPSEQNGDGNTMTLYYIIGGVGLLFIITFILLIIIGVKWYQIRKESSHRPAMKESSHCPEMNSLMRKPQQEQHKDTFDPDPDPQ